MTTYKHYAATKKVILLCIFILMVSPTGEALTWLGVHKEIDILPNSTKICRKIAHHYNLTETQIRICRKFKDAMPHVHQAAALAVATCQNLFKFRRWNCSSMKLLPHLTPDLTSGTREQALVYALSSAALTYSVARGCATSSIGNCGCSDHPEEPPNGNFKWGGCGDNVRWGIQFSRQFMDANKKLGGSINGNRRRYRKRRRNVRHMETDYIEDNDISTVDHKTELMAEINFHNSRIGRKLLLNAITVQCKCHGVSGSCSVKTCWKSLPFQFSELGERLMESYNSAIEVHSLQLPSSISRYEDSPSLLYVTKSPDYCEPDLNTGSFGTRGRLCNSNTSDHTSCNDMCCGRGYRTKREHIKERCDCKYVACCYVECNTCNVTRVINVCN